MQHPTVILVMAMSTDGFITKHQGGLVDWTSKEDKKHFRTITKEVGAVIFGKKTFDTFPGPLPNRLNLIMTRTPDESKNEEGQLEFTNKEPKELLRDLAKREYEQVVLGGGSQINKLFLEQDLVDEIYLTIEPKLFGSGHPLLAECQIDLDLELVHMTNLTKDSILLHYKVKK